MYNSICILKWRAACVWWILGDRSTGVGSYLVPILWQNVGTQDIGFGEPFT